MSLRKFTIFHPVFLAIYPVLFLYSRNIGEVYISHTLKPVLIILAGTVTAWILLRVLTASWHKSAMVTSLFLLLFFSYEPVCVLFSDELSDSIAVIWLLLFMAGSVLIVKLHKSLEKWTMILNVFSSVLVIFTLAGIISYAIAGARGSTQLSYDNDDGVASDVKVSSSETYPDIYFIVLDAYARQDILREIYNFDNSDFIEFLQKKGFYVADKCAANYCQTGPSLASCLNMSYLNAGKDAHCGIDQKFFKKEITKSSVRQFLRERGYKTVSFASSIFYTSLDDADVYLKSVNLVNMFHSSVLNATPLPYILNLIRKPKSFDIHREHITYILDNLGKISNTYQWRKFVFVHLEIPHPPFVFGPQGESVTVGNSFVNFDGDWLIRKGRISREQYKKAYCDQVSFINMRMKKVINEILNNSSQPPIILILGDHGPRSETKWGSSEQTNVKECLTNLGAFYLPDGGEKLLYPDMTLVNLFRVIYKHYFNKNEDFLPDRCYYSTARNFCVFYDVTDRVRQAP
jgi:hypothetical protein